MSSSRTSSDRPKAEPKPIPLLAELVAHLCTGNSDRAQMWSDKYKLPVKDRAMERGMGWQIFGDYIDESVIVSSAR